MTRTQLDLCDLRCPLPVLRTRRALRSMEVGDVLVVQCTDPLAGVDIPLLVIQTGDRLVSTLRRGETLEFTIQRASPDDPREPSLPAC